MNNYHVFWFSMLLVIISIIFLTTCAYPKDEPVAIFSFVFDDVNTTDSTVYSKFLQYGIRPSFGLITNYFTDTSAINAYLRYQSDGCSILSHSVTHRRLEFPSTDLETATFELKQSKRTLDSLGFIVRGFVAPYSVLDSSYINVLKSVYKYAFINNEVQSHDFSQDVDKYNLTRYSAEVNCLDSVKAQIDRVISIKGFCTFYAHTFPGSGTGWVFDNAKLTGILDYLKMKQDSSKCIFLNADDAIVRFYQLNVVNIADKITPCSFNLYQNYPNPFNPSTVIKYSLPSECSVVIKFFNSIGQCVRVLPETTRQPGNYEILFNSAGLTSGIYFFSIKAVATITKQEFNAVKKMILIK